jgi:transforming growth factor-beta-induced protein
MTDIMASNGVIHVINKVLLPSIADIATTDGRFGSLVAAAVLADTATPVSPNLVAALDNDTAEFTVFAPIDSAFTGLVTDLGVKSGITMLADFKPYQVIPVLNYHLVAGKKPAAMLMTGTLTTRGGTVAVVNTAGAVTVDGNPVILANIIARNGYIHVINKVLLPSIVDVATTDMAFSTLADAIVRTDATAATPKLIPLLDGPGAFTVFAPTNMAFMAPGLVVPAAGQALTDLIAYHGVNNKVYASEAIAFPATGTDVQTLLATKKVKVSASGTPKAVFVGDSTATKAKVIVTDVFTSNGVIHAIDKVLIP